MNLNGIGPMHDRLPYILSSVSFYHTAQCWFDVRQFNPFHPFQILPITGPYLCAKIYLWVYESVWVWMYTN